MNKKSTFVKWRRYLPLYLMLIPGAVYIFINNYIPMAGLIMAFENMITNWECLRARRSDLTTLLIYLPQKMH